MRALIGQLICWHRERGRRDRYERAHVQWQIDNGWDWWTRP